jgi:ATP-dependent helicase/nuclease subunit A
MSASQRPRNVVIRASAGTGKTYQLSNRFIRLLASGVPASQILATTFTRKAAGEILDRVLLRLAQAATDAAQARELATAIGDSEFTPERARALLAACGRNLHELRVGTLDKWFIQLASSFSLELGLPAGWVICDEQVERNLRDEAIERVLARGRLPELLTLMNLLSKGAAIRSVSRLVLDTVNELLELYREAVPSAWEQIQPPKGLSEEDLIETINEAAAFPLEGRAAAARDKDLETARLGEWDDFIGKGLASKVLSGENAYYKKPIPPQLVQLYQRLLVHAESILVGQVKMQTEAAYNLLRRFAEEYSALQAEERALRFSDVTHLLGGSAEFNQGGQWAFRMDSPIKHLLLDEFQDTSPAQWQVLRPLAQSLAKGRGTSFFCVGDAKQAIYGWRGGVAEIFDALDDELGTLTPATLATSFRSSPPIVETVNRVFQNLLQHPNLDKLDAPVRAFQQAFPPHSTARTELPGYVRMEFSPPADEDEDDDQRHFEYAAQVVARHVEASPTCSIGVLMRTNEAVARMIYQLRNSKVLASEEGGNPLIDSPAVEVILSLLKLADHPGDKVARFHLANSPLASHLGLSDHRDGFAAAKLARRLRRDLLDQGYGPVVFLWAQRLAEYCDRRDLSRLQQLVEAAYAWQPKSTLRTADFLASVESGRVSDPSAADVRVMTIHQAKGLEFDIVVLPELEAKLTGETATFVAGRPGPTQPIDVVCRHANVAIRQFFPERLQNLFEADHYRDITESLCVLYVALTRAVHCLSVVLEPPAENEKSLPKTFGGLLRGSLADDPLAATVGAFYEYGDPKWCAQVPAKACAKAPIAADTPLRLAPPLADRHRGLNRSSPSHLEGGQRTLVARLFDQDPRALEYGTVTHAWLERVAWLDAELPSDEELRRIACTVATRLVTDRPMCHKLIGDFRRHISQPGIAALLSRPFYDQASQLGFADPSAACWKPAEITLEVLPERKFAIRDSGQILSGSIDRLVLIRRGGKLIAADVIDFKTDTLPPKDPHALASKTAFYQPQVAAYRRAVAKLYALKERQIAARLAFLSAGLVVPV